MSDPGGCVKKHGKLKKKDMATAVSRIEEFCGLLRANKVKDSKELFLQLPYVIQCLFLHYSWQILSKKSKYSDDSYLTAFRLFKLFRSKELKAKPIYSKYLSLKTVETQYKNALEWNRKVSPSTKSTGNRTRKKYDKEFQKAVEPSSETDPLYIYYTTLYKQKADSPLAITWLTEHGVYDGEERKKLIKKYKKLSEKGKLVK